MADKLIVSTPVDMEGQDLCDSVLNLPTIKAFPEEPIVGRPGMVYYDARAHEVKFFDGTDWRPMGVCEWGEISGTLSHQTDLQTELNKRDILPTKVPNRFLHTNESGGLEWITGGGGSTVTYTPTLMSGKELGRLVIDGEVKPLYCMDTSGCLLIDGSRSMIGDLSMMSKRVINMGAPQDARDATNKQYVDNRVRVSETGASTQVVRYITVGGDEYRLAQAVGTTIVTCTSGYLSAVCPSKSAFMNVLGYTVSLYADPTEGKVIVNGKETEAGATVAVGPYEIAVSYASNTFNIRCPIGTTFLQDQAGEAAMGTTIVTLNDSTMREEGHEYPLNYPNALNVFDEIILCIIENDAQGRLYDRVMFRPKRYINKFYYERYEDDDEDHYLEFYFTSNGPTGQYDVAKLTHTVRLECVGMYGKKYGKIDGLNEQTPNTANALNSIFKRVRQ